MRAPVLDSPGPSFAVLFSRSGFSQNKFLDGRRFAEAARQRGIAVDRFPRKMLERLDRVGAVCPIAFSQANYDVETTWWDPDPEYMIWREERNFEPWESHAWTFEPDGSKHVSEKYSPWQLLYVGEALRLDVVPVPVATLASGDLAPYIADAAQRRAAQRSLDEEWRPSVKLLVALQARLWPFRAGKTTLLSDPEREPNSDRDYVDPVEREAERFDPARILDQFGLDLHRLAELHRLFAIAAASLDPMPTWYRLVEIAPRKQTDMLRGDALRARDLHDACFLLRGLYHLATDQWLPRADEIDHPVIDWRRAHLPRRNGALGGTREELQAVLEREGLYPHRIHFVVEGETEEIILRRLLEAMGRTTGYQVTNLRGVDKAEQHQALFAAASQYAARTVLIADMEGSLAAALRRLQRDGLLADDADLLLWEVDGRPSSFEHANFRPQEVVDAIIAAGRKRVPDLQFDLTGEQLAPLYADAAAEAERNGDDPPAFANYALKLARDRHVPVSKGELALELAEITMGLVEEAGTLHDAATEERPLLRRLWRWLMETR